MPHDRPSSYATRVTALRHLLRRGAAQALGMTPLARASLALAPRRLVIFMLHRFRSEDSTDMGHDPRELRRALALLRSARVPVLSLDDVASQLNERGDWDWDGPAVVFTIDDAYLDCLSHGLPVFREYDAPVTVFVSPGIIDTHSWFWWDQVEWLVARQIQPRISLVIAGEQIEFPLASASERAAATMCITERLKHCSPSERQAVIGTMGATACAALPDTPPDEFAIARWDAIRAAESTLVRFGAHSMHHPILRYCSDVESRAEIGDSIRRLREELRLPSDVFCYPNGLEGDFTHREEQLVQQAGMLAAVSAISGVLDLRTAPAPAGLRWRLPRIPFGDSAGDVVLELLRKT